MYIDTYTQILSISVRRIRRKRLVESMYKPLNPYPFNPYPLIHTP
jgi:hypothetical protein